MHSASLIAKYIIERCDHYNQTISNLKLQKILYFVQAEFLVAENRRCFFEEIEAWDYGPVVPNVYRKYKMYGAANIPYVGDKTEFTAIDKKEKDLLNCIIDKVFTYSASALTEITCNQSPWKDTYIPGRYNVISTDKIKAFFQD